MTKLPLVIVEWADAWTTETPASLDGPMTHKPEMITTIGWVLRDDEEGIQLANEYYDSTYRGRTFILRSMVRKVTPYRLAKPRAERPKVEPKDKETTTV